MDKIEWNKVIYADCMNEQNGLPTLPDKSIDLCLTDPPYHVNYKDDLHACSIQYDDNFLGFDWFEQILRICKGVIFTSGAKHYQDYVRYKKSPYFLRFAYYYDSHQLIKYDLLLSYGSIPRITHLRSVILAKKQRFENFSHPSPKSLDLWLYILRKLKPLSIIDPFLGSGTTLEACIKLGIKWIGYELNEVYKTDINRRIARSKREKTQLCLKVFINE